MLIFISCFIVYWWVSVELSLCAHVRSNVVCVRSASQVKVSPRGEKKANVCGFCVLAHYVSHFFFFCLGRPLFSASLRVAMDAKNLPKLLLLLFNFATQTVQTFGSISGWLLMIPSSRTRGDNISFTNKGQWLRANVVPTHQKNRVL